MSEIILEIRDFFARIDLYCLLLTTPPIPEFIIVVGNVFILAVLGFPPLSALDFISLSVKLELFCIFVVFCSVVYAGLVFL